VIHATYFSHEFIAAYLQEYRKVYRPLSAEMDAVANKWTSRKIRKECFFMAAYTGERDWNDFALSNSIWRIYMENDRGVKEMAVSVSEAETKDKLVRHFFPYFDDFYEAYEVCFDRYPGSRPGDSGLPKPILDESTRSFSLVLCSPVGELRLEWAVSE